MISEMLSGPTIATIATDAGIFAGIFTLSFSRFFAFNRGMSDVTRILERVEQGDSRAAHELLPLVYDELRRLAAHKMACEAAGHTLQPTALVHEAWLRLVDSPNPHWNGRNHFFMAAAEAMRRVLVERARQKGRLKRGGNLQRVPLDDLDLAIHADSDDLLLIEEALQRLDAHDTVKAELVKLRFFVGLSLEDAAPILGVSEPTAKRYWAYARAWLFQEIERLR
jgi:RNA polymerase sigma factor (TIGR02999 family)